jgi:predicted metal-dependent phosphoesterase TrpH
MMGMKMSGMLKVDLHMHTHFSHDSGAPSESIVKRCLKTGLNYIAVTDHNTIRGALEVRSLAPFPVIVGEEVKSAGGDIIGLFLKEEIPRGLSPLDTVRAIREQGGLVMVPHPFDRVRPSAIKYEALKEILPYVDIMESYNCHNLFRSDNQKAAAFTRERRIIPAAVSDSHTPLELGRTYMEVPEFDGTPEGFKDALSRATLVSRKAHHILRLTSIYAKAKNRLFG